MSETVDLTFDGDVATLTIDRPERLNALNGETLDAVSDALDEARGDARALVVTGAGDKAFVAGADISRMSEMGVAEAEAYCRTGHAVMNAVEEFPAPVIAAVNGYAFGGGCELALACDFRVASERAVIGQTEIDLGIVPGWGGTQRLVRLVGDATARRLVMFGDRIDASDAYEQGLVGEVVAHDDLDDHVAEMAAELAEKPRFAMAAAKEAINQAHEMGQREGLDFERRTWSSLFGTPDQEEGMNAFLDDREPDFE
ncbi:enoyl-CoA hydratase/isomerase family protein [Halosegnis marinus]|uniref:Enoyl-CoA hydratase/isomerase family protein n=1 Tax=Halosegnis marinus TaxID=3034023 RepID=A0ABD5ZR78_9EURY|nr:enoyl-CoA hydratase-related protein [Halosegnis sp. DT85]